MAGRGPHPKPAGKSQGRRKKATASTMTALPANAPKLPRRSPTWRKSTREWWAAVWSSPMAEHFLDADVPALVRIAELVDRLDRLGPDDDALALKLTGEIRLQEARFGLSPGDRLRLHWAVRPPADPAPKRRTRKYLDENDPRRLLAGDNQRKDGSDDPADR